MLTDRREALTRRRVQTVNRLQALLAELLPGQAKKDITALPAKAMLAGVRRCWSRRSTHPASAGPSTGQTCGGWWTGCPLHLAHRLPVAVSARVIRSLDAGVVPVPPLVAQRHLGSGADRAAPGGARGRGPGWGHSVNGGHRHPPGPRRVQRRDHLPRPRRGLRAREGRQARRGGGCDRPPARRPGGPRVHSREPHHRVNAGAPSRSGRKRTA